MHTSIHTYLFNLYEIIDMLRFADAITVITDNEEDLKNILGVVTYNNEKLV